METILESIPNILALFLLRVIAAARICFTYPLFSHYLPLGRMIERVVIPTRWRVYLKTSALLLLMGVATARVCSTYRVLSQVYDEPATVSPGLEWLEKGTYVLDPVHPPLGRVAAALPLYLEGIRLSGKRYRPEGNEILHARGRYLHNLAMARLGILPFFLLATALVWVWSRELFGDGVALVATLFFTTLPPVLAEAGFATTDMPATGTLTGSLLALTYWLDRPSYPRSVLLGLSTGLAILSKFSAPPFLMATAGLVLIVRRLLKDGKPVPPRADRGTGARSLPALCVAVFLALLVIWGGYRFSLRRIVTVAQRPHQTIDRYLGVEGALHNLAYTAVETIPLPAPDLFTGIRWIKQKLADSKQEYLGYYLFGRTSKTGWWYYFPVVFAIKTPIPFLILMVAGGFFIGRQVNRRRDWRLLVPALGSIAILIVCAVSGLDVGLRYMLPVYPLLSIVAGYGASGLWNFFHDRPAGRILVVALVGWELGSSIYAHPDYVAYFNQLAGKHPERIIVTNDLDFGQDLSRLVITVRSMGINELAISYFGSADLERHGLPPFRLLVPHERTTGWVAISLFNLKTGGFQGPSDAFTWLEAYTPVKLVGRSIRLYYVPASTDDQQHESP